MVIHNLLTLT